MENVVKFLQLCKVGTITLNRKLHNLAPCFPFLFPNSSIDRLNFSITRHYKFEEHEIYYNQVDRYVIGSVHAINQFTPVNM